MPESKSVQDGRALTGKVVSVDWQGGRIMPVNGAETLPYHKCDVWVDDKKVKQLPREGDTVTFFVTVDEITRKEKAEQVNVINWTARSPAKSTPTIRAADVTATHGNFVFEHCTGRVVAVNTPIGFIQLDADENHPPVPYHYSDVWDDGKCVKQFPRLGDTVSCYITIDSKTRQEKAEMVKVISKRQQAYNKHAAQQVPQTIQQAHLRAQMHTTPNRIQLVHPGSPPMPVPMLLPQAPLPAHIPSHQMAVVPLTPPRGSVMPVTRSPAAHVPITPPRQPHPYALSHLESVPFTKPLPPSPLVERPLPEKLLECEAEASTELAATLAAEAVLDDDEGVPSPLRNWDRSVFDTSNTSADLLEQRILLRSPIITRLPLSTETHATPFRLDLASKASEIWA